MSCGLIDDADHRAIAATKPLTKLQELPLCLIDRVRTKRTLL
jgi:hypothetical protein